MAKLGKGDRTMSKVAIGKRIKELREERNITREELAGKAEISTKFLYEVENGKKGLSAGTLLKIAKALSSSCDFILTGEYTEKEKGILSEFNEKQLKNIDEILELIYEMCKEC